MFEIAEIVKSLQDLTKRYGLKILYVDFTDITLISRIGFDRDRTDDLLNAMYLQACLAFYPLFSLSRFCLKI